MTRYAKRSANGSQLIFHLVGAEKLSHACQTVLSLAFFVDATKEMGTSYVSLKQAASNKYNLGLVLCFIVCNVQTQHWFIF